MTDRNERFEPNKRSETKRYVPLESNEPQVIGSITNQLLFELLSELKLIRGVLIDLRNKS